MKKYSPFHPMWFVCLLSVGFVLLVPQARAQTPPNPPHGLGIFDRSHVSFRVWWHAPDTGGGAPITGYDVRYKDTLKFDWLPTVHTTHTQLEIDGLSPGISYEVQARAVSADGTSAGRSQRIRER